MFVYNSVIHIWDGFQNNTLKDYSIIHILLLRIKLEFSLIQLRKNFWETSEPPVRRIRRKSEKDDKSVISGLTSSIGESLIIDTDREEDNLW